ncbi:MAG: hypothetical protein U0703_03540 [Anaerolineae bacterium]
MEICFADRLNYPNKPTPAQVEEPLTAAMSDLYGAHGFSVEPGIHDRRYLFTAAVYGDEIEIAEMLQPQNAWSRNRTDEHASRPAPRIGSAGQGRCHGFTRSLSNPCDRHFNFARIYF